MLAVLGRAEKFGQISFVGGVVDSDRAVVEADSKKIRIIGVEIQTHDAAVSVVNDLGIRWILERVEENNSLGLLQEVV